MGSLRCCLPVLALAVLASCGCDGRRPVPAWVAIPSGTLVCGSPDQPRNPPREVTHQEFSIQPTEVTVGDFLAFLNDVGPPFPGWSSPQVERREDGRWWALVDPRLPVTHVSPADARAYAAAVGAACRLPTPDEWEIAARGGVHGARHPWGWNPPSPDRARFAADGPVPAGTFPPNPIGLYDSAGNVAEWAVDEDGTTWLMGGSWADRDPAMLRVDARVPHEPDYRGPDAGFRLVQVPRNTAADTRPLAPDPALP